jgi:outer membrane protein TolC
MIPLLAGAEPPGVTIGMVLDGPWDRSDEITSMFREEISDILEGEFEVRFPQSKTLVADYTLPEIQSSLDRLVEDADVDIVIAMGPLVSGLALEGGPLSKPVVAPFVVGAWVDDPPMKQGASGVPNLAYLIVPAALETDLRIFREVVPFRKLAFLMTGAFVQAAPHKHDVVLPFMRELGIEKISQVYALASADDVLAQIPPDVEAVYLSPLMTLSDEEFDRLVQGLIERKLPTFSMLGRSDVERGILAGLNTDALFDQRARRVALMVQRILLGESPETLLVAIASEKRLSINMATARAIGISPSWEIINEADLVDEERKDVERRLTLGRAMREAVKVNLELESERRAVAAGRQDVKNARASLLPQINLDATAAFIDEDRATASFGQVAERSYSGSATATQLIFGEPAMANLSIQKHLQREREEGWETVRLDIAEGAALAYLNVLGARTVERIEKDNLKVTRENLELARVRSAIGSAGPAEVYRWEAEIAQRRSDAIRANSQRNLAEMEMNRILHRPLEESFLPEETGLDDPDLILSLAPPYVYIDNRMNFRLLRDYLVEETLVFAPELRRLDAVIEAQDRFLKSQGRQYYLPTIALQGKVENIFEKQGAGSDGGFDVSGLPPELSALGSVFPESADDTHWQIGVSASLPLFQGGSRFSTHRKAREELEQLKTQRAAVAERIEQRIRSALHSSGASYASIRLSQQAAQAAAQTLELVTDAYARGAVSILDLLDAQNAALRTEETAAIAVYQFLADYVRVQRAVGRFDVFSTAEEKRERIQRLEDYIVEHGGTIPGR